MTYKQIEKIFIEHYGHGLMESFRFSDCKVEIIKKIVELSKKKKVNRFQVITRIQSSNEYDEAIIKDGLYFKPFSTELLKEYGASKVERLKLPVFTLGEILIVDNEGREVGPIGRKPSKWFVDFEEFTTVEDAIKRSQELLIAN